MSGDPESPLQALPLPLPLPKPLAQILSPRKAAGLKLCSSEEFMRDSRRDSSTSKGSPETFRITERIHTLPFGADHTSRRVSLVSFIATPPMWFWMTWEICCTHLSKV